MTKTQKEGDSMQTPNRTAPGGPGIPARWTSSAKTGVGTALSNKSHVWFTLSHGIFNEIYYPRIDQACVRDMGMIVTDGADFFSEEKRDAGHKVEWLADGVPAFRLVNTCRDGRYRIEKQIVTDPHRDTVLQQVQFVAQKGASVGLSPSRPARAAPGKPRRWQYRLGGRIRGHAAAVCAAERQRVGAGVLRSVVEAVCRLRRFVRRLAGPEGAQTDDLGIHAGRKRQCGPDCRDRSCKVAGRLSYWRSVLATTRTKRPGMPSPACATVLTRQSATISPAGRNGRRRTRR